MLDAQTVVRWFGEKIMKDRPKGKLLICGTGGQTMSQKKQIIEEMAHELCGMNSSCEVCSLDKLCLARNCADIFYNVGYRKQSEWISVEEKLPSESGKYLVCTKRGNVYQTKFYSYPEDKGGHWGQKDKGKSITHWMAMPEAPKGGEE